MADPRAELQPASLTWVPVETAVNNVEGQDVKGDRGAVQRHVDASGVKLQYQTHFSHVKVSIPQ